MMLMRLRSIPVVLSSLVLVSCGGSESTEPDTTVASVAVSGTATLTAGTTTQLTATAKNSAGAILSGLTATWSSSHTEVATVNNSGLVSGLTDGTTTITATISGVSGVRVVTVGSSSNNFPADAAVEASAANTFVPPSVDISAGGTVTWTFNGGTASPHNVTFSTSGAPSNIATMTSGTASRTFSTPGTYDYHCTNHPGMNGTVVVH